MVIILFFVAVYLLSQIYASKVLNANEDDFPSMELSMEGIGSCFGLFMLSWIAVFSFQ
jgi:hypothetical protein